MSNVENSTMETIKRLRARSSAGIMDCKKALTACNNDVDKAIEWLRKEGIAKADRKGDRSTIDGAVAIFINKDKASASIVWMGTETDFVAKNDNFLRFTTEITHALANYDDGDLYINDICDARKSFLKSNTKVSATDDARNSKDNTVEDAIKHGVAVFGENIKLIVAKKLKINDRHGLIASYIHNAFPHHHNTGKVIAAVALKLEKNCDKCMHQLEELGHKIAMHIVASSPLAINISDLSQDIIKKEKAIVREEAQKSGKAEAVIEKMIDGRMRKFYEEVVLMQQIFVMGNVNIQTLLEEKSKEFGCNISISGFIKVAVGDVVAASIIDPSL